MAGDWVRYWRWAGQPVEAMHAHFERHVYHRHAHETYSFGVTESGAQAFTCRGGARVSGAGMVMAFNPGDPHDGHAARPAGFTYRMVHISPDLVAGVLADRAGQDWVGRDWVAREQSGSGLPLFTQPVIADRVLARAVRRLHRSLTGDTPALARDEALNTAVAALAAQPHLNRWFTRYLGITPASYRRALVTR